MSALIQDLKYSLRMLAKNPGFTAVAVLTLALGIGANAAMFSVINAALLSPLPYKHAERLVWLGTTHPRFDHPIPVSGADFLDWKSRNSVFEYMSAVDTTQGFTLTGKGEPEILSGAFVSANFFKLFDEKPERGRWFAEGEDQPGHNRVAVLGYDLWKNRFGADPNVLGSNLILNAESYTVVGVAPQGSAYPSWVELWLPIVISNDNNRRGNHYLRAIGRLKPGASLPEAQAEMSTIAGRIAREHPESNQGIGVQLIPLKEWLVQFVRPALLILFAAVGFVLLIACANVANLLLARATKRRKEIALRAALGAGRFRLIRQFLAETILLSLVAGGLAVVLATWSLDVLGALNPNSIPDADKIHLDLHVLGFLLSVSLLIGVALGLVPAFRASKVQLNESLKESGGIGVGGTGGGNARNVLVVAEIALSLVLLAGAGLMIRSFARLISIDPGYDPHNLLTFQISLPEAGYSGYPRQLAFYREALDRIKACPGVRSVAISNTLPPSGGEIDAGFYVEGHEPGNINEAPDTILDPISPGYFQTMKIPLIAGRYFTEPENSVKSRVVIINESLARRFLAGENPVGKRMKTGADGMKEWYEIVGVVADERFFGWDTDVQPTTYFPLGLFLQGNMAFVVRTQVDPLSMTSSMQKAIWSVDKDLPLTQVRTMDQRLVQSFAARRFQMILLGAFAGLALMLSAVGIYGVMSYSVTQRVHEIGIRMALGAERRHVLNLVLRQTLALTVIGLGAGLAGAFALTRFLSNLLYGVQATDPSTLVAVTTLLATVAVLAGYVPARRATKVDPMVALRYE